MADHDVTSIALSLAPPDMGNSWFIWLTTYTKSSTAVLTTAPPMHVPGAHCSVLSGRCGSRAVAMQATNFVRAAFLAGGTTLELSQLRQSAGRRSRAA